MVDPPSQDVFPSLLLLERNGAPLKHTSATTTSSTLPIGISLMIHGTRPMPMRRTIPSILRTATIRVTQSTRQIGIAPTTPSIQLIGSTGTIP